MVPPSTQLVSSDQLPPPDAELREILRFSDTYNPAPYFNEQWGKEYQDRAGNLLAKHREEYLTNNTNRSNSPEELLLSLAMACALGPYIVTEKDHESHVSFMRWIIECIRLSLDD